MKTLGAFGAGILSGNIAEAQTSAPPAKSWIDVHHHIFPPAFLDAAKEAFSTPATRARLVSEWTPQRALAQMDQNGIATAIVSITNPGI
jgi:hypothetical protein